MEDSTMSSPEPTPSAAGDSVGASAAQNPRNPRACRQCAVTKIKCTFRPGSGSEDPCDRCQRLGKDCQAQQAAVGPRKKRSKSTKVAALEKKIDGLYQLLSNQAQQSRDGASESQPQSSTASPYATQNARREDDRTRSQGLPEPDQVQMRQFLPVDDSTLDAYNYYRTRMAPHFPFVYIPPDASPAEIRESSPMFFKLAVTVASIKSLHEQRDMQRRNIAEIVQKLMLKAEKSLDILQAILVLVAWFQPYVFAIPQLTNLLYLASALVVDLGINHPPQNREKRGINHFHKRMAHGEAANRVHESPEQMRALLGWFYMHSTLSKSFRAMDDPKFTPYMEYCCKTLLEAKETPSDIHLVNLIRIQRFCENIGPNSAIDLQRQRGPLAKAPLDFYVAAMAADLQEIKAALPSSLSTPDLAIQIAAAAAEIHLYEYAYFNASPNPSALTLSNNAQASDYQYRCLSAIASMMAAYNKMPPAAHFDVPMTNWAHMSEMLMVMCALFLQSDGRNWRGQAARAYMDPLVEPVQVMTEIITRFERAHIEANVPDNQMFIYMKKRMEMFRAWAEDRHNSDQRTQHLAATGATFGAASSRTGVGGSGSGGGSSTSGDVASMDWGFLEDEGIMDGGLFAADIGEGWFQEYFSTLPPIARLDSAQQQRSLPSMGGGMAASVVGQGQGQGQGQQVRQDNWNLSSAFTQNSGF